MPQSIDSYKKQFKHSSFNARPGLDGPLPPLLA